MASSFVSNRPDLAINSLEISTSVKFLDSPDQCRVIICHLHSERVTKIRANALKQTWLLSIFFSWHTPLAPRFSVVLQQLCSVPHVRKLPFWEHMFGSKAVETGAFRTAWAPVISLTECQSLNTLNKNQMCFVRETLCGAISLLDSSSQMKVCFPFLSQ